VDRSTPLLHEVVLEIDANPTSFDVEWERRSVTFGSRLASLQNTENEANSLLPSGRASKN